MMMKRGYLILPSLLFQCLVLMGQENPDQFPEAGAREENHLMRVTARVIDEEGNPMAGVPVRIGIHNVNDFRDQYNDFRGKTNEAGKFSAEGIGRGLAKIDVQKEGYYLSRKTVTCYEGNEQQIRKAGRYSPWNPTIDVMIKKIGKPVPMIVRRGNRCRSWVEPNADQLEKELGWDLVEGDWVAPHGRGKMTDLIFRFESSYTDESNKMAKVNIRFANPNDGLVSIKELKGEGSRLKYPREAPLQGYENKNIELVSKVFEDWRKLKNRPQAYLLRIRTQKDVTGNIVSALYGKITKPYRLFPPAIRYRLPTLNFDYYLNPTPNDRNLEYDQRNNLAPEADRGLTWPP